MGAAWVLLPTALLVPKDENKNFQSVPICARKDFELRFVEVKSRNGYGFIYQNTSQIWKCIFFCSYIFM